MIGVDGRLVDRLDKLFGPSSTPPTTIPPTCFRDIRNLPAGKGRRRPQADPADIPASDNRKPQTHGSLADAPGLKIDQGRGDVKAEVDAATAHVDPNDSAASEKTKPRHHVCLTRVPLVKAE